MKADDEAEPGQSRSDTAEVNVIVGSGQGVRLFPLRLYDVLVFENQLAPQVKPIHFYAFLRLRLSLWLSAIVLQDRTISDRCLN